MRRPLTPFRRKRKMSELIAALELMGVTVSRNYYPYCWSYSMFVHVHDENWICDPEKRVAVFELLCTYAGTTDFDRQLLLHGGFALTTDFFACFQQDMGHVVRSHVWLGMMAVVGTVAGIAGAILIIDLLIRVLS